MIEINNLTSFSIDEKLFTGIAKIVLKSENRVREKISLAFVSEEEIKKLNKKFRKKNKATDVLSFDLKPACRQGRKKGYLGEIVICPEIVKENAKKHRSGAKQETMKVFIHGILHLCGYDHEKNKKQAKIMEDKEKLYLDKIRSTKSEIRNKFK